MKCVGRNGKKEVEILGVEDYEKGESGRKERVWGVGGGLLVGL